VNHPTGTELLAEGLASGHDHVAGVVLVLGLLFGVQVIEVAVELVETVIGRQMLVPVAEVVLAELAGGIPASLEQTGDGRFFFTHAKLGAGETDLAEAGAEHTLPHDEGRAPRGAALLAVVVGKDHPLVGDTVDIGCVVPHQALGVGADVGLPDIVAPDDQDIGLVLG
jgi:hypothetical protein